MLKPMVGTINCISSEFKNSRSDEQLPGLWITIQKKGTKGPSPSCREKHWIPDEAGTRSLIFEAHLNFWPVYVDAAGVLRREEEAVPEPQHTDIEGQCSLFEGAANGQ